MDAEFPQLKNESKRELFSAAGDAKKRANRTSITAFEVRLMI